MLARVIFLGPTSIGGVVKNVCNNRKSWTKSIKKHRQSVNSTGILRKTWSADVGVGICLGSPCRCSGSVRCSSPVALPVHLQRLKNPMDYLGPIPGPIGAPVVS